MIQNIDSILTCVRETINYSDELRNFATDHDVKFDPTNGCIVNKDTMQFGLFLDYVDEALKYMGYTITVTEVSDANNAVSSLKGRDWHKINKFRWELVWWDKHGTMIALKYSDNLNDHNFFDSEADARRDAIDFILKNYKEIEEI